jgi:hypothetical protein
LWIYDTANVRVPRTGLKAGVRGGGSPNRLA